MATRWRGARALRWGLALGLVAAVLGAPPAVAENPTGALEVVLSASLSMRDTVAGLTKASTVRHGVVAFVDEMPAGGRVALRTYGAAKDPGDPAACADTKRVVDLGTNNRAKLLAGLNDYHASGDAPVATALTEAAADLAGKGKATIVLVSDGTLTCTPTPCDTAATLAAANPQLVVNVIGVAASGDGEAALTCIAERSGGSYVRAESVRDVANAMETFAQSTVRPVDVKPVPISGGGDGSTAAEVVTGEYTDTLGAVGTDSAVRFYALPRTIPSSDLAVSASLVPVAGTDDGIIVEVSQSGRTCESDTQERYGASESVVVALAVVGAGHTSYPDCVTASRLLVKVERTTHGTAPSSAEIGVRLRFSEHEPVSNASSLPTSVTVADAASSLSAGSPVTVTPGSSFTDGARLASGSTYAGTIVPGQVQTFRLSVQWGQKLSAKVIALEPKPSVKTALKDRQQALSLRIVSPLGGSRWGSHTTSLASGGYTYVDTSPVVYRGQPEQMQAGEYAVVVGLEVDGDPTGITIPYQVVVQTSGPETGTPLYGPPGSVTTSPSASATTATSTAAPLPTSGMSLTTRLWIGFLGALLAGVGFGAWFQLRRLRNRRDRMPGAEA